MLIEENLENKSTHLNKIILNPQVTSVDNFVYFCESFF